MPMVILRRPAASRERFWPGRPVDGAMTDLLWMPAADGARSEDNPNYVRRFDGKVLKALDDWVMLDRTAFYAEGGGQPSDVGLLTWDGGEARVQHVSKRGAVKHQLEGGRLPPQGTPVHGEIDWDLRHRHMRMHTAQHILSGVVWRTRAGRTAGNQLHADRSRIDFEPAKLSPEDLRDVESEVNRILAADLPVRVYEEDRSVLEARLKADDGAARNLMTLVPQSVRRLRIVEVYDPDESLPPYGRTIDVCPCAGTHVARTGEIGRMEILGRETKGAGKERVEYLLK